MNGLGYRRDLENFASLEANSKPLVIHGAFTAPHSISHRAWRKAKSQGHVGSCSGFSRASGEEILNYIATGGGVKRFSDMYAYLENQKACGLFGSDQGAFIDGSVKAAAESGICLEETFPYPNRYVTTIPPAAESEGKDHVIRSHTVMQSYDDCLKWLSSGVGVILTGTDWTTRMQSLVGKTMELTDLRGQLLGGHARVLEGYDGDTVDADGRPYLDDENSHGPDWGDGGWCLISPRVIDYWFDSGATLIGISDLESYGPRKITDFRGVVA